MVRRRLVIGGLVQGVFFRDSCRQQAERFGVHGWVRNLADGRVEAVFEGPAEDVAAMVEWARSGPPRARVDGVEITDEDPAGETSFRVR